MTNSRLHTAVANNDIKLVQVLLDNGFDINAENGQGNTALNIAILRSNNNITKLLVERGADVNHKDHNGRPPLWYAVSRNDTAFAQLLFKHKATPSLELLNTLFIRAVNDRNDIEMIRLFLEKGAAINTKNEQNNTALNIAIIHDKENIIKLLIERGADVNHKDNKGLPPLWYAVSYNNTAFIQRLLEQRATPSLELLNIMIDKAINYNNLTAIQCLLDKKAEIETKDKNNIALRDALSKGDIANATLLLNNGADVNSKNLDDQTPLHLATAHKHQELAKLLIEKGADVNAQDKKMRTPLYLACEAKQYATIQTLAAQRNADGSIKCSVELLPRGITTLLELFPDDKKDNNVAEIQSILRGIGCKEKKSTILQSIHNAVINPVVYIFAAIYDAMHQFLSILFPSLFNHQDSSLSLDERGSQDGNQVNSQLLEQAHGVPSLALSNAESIALTADDVADKPKPFGASERSPIRPWTAQNLSKPEAQESRPIMCIAPIIQHAQPNALQPSQTRR